jgi:NAD(P)-dependent dehydrogenase (short-subunit alcohol dehydrogenase family)
MNTVREDAVHPLAGQVAVVTGAGRGIGAAIARTLSSLGATAILCGRTRGTLESSCANDRAGGREGRGDPV